MGFAPWSFPSFSPASEFQAELHNLRDTTYTYQKTLKVDPKFVSSTDFDLQSSSLAIDGGIDVGLPYRGTAPDIGAFEFGP